MEDGAVGSCLSVIVLWLLARAPQSASRYGITMSTFADTGDRLSIQLGLGFSAARGRAPQRRQGVYRSHQTRVGLRVR